MMVRDLAAGGFLRVNAAFRERIGHSAEELAEAPFIDWVDAADQGLVEAISAGGSCRARHRTRSGDSVELEIRISGQSGVVLARLVEADALVPEGEAPDEGTVSGTLETIARIVEEQNPGYRCSILLVEAGHFVRGAGPSLPESYNAAIDGYAVGPTVGSCGTAIYWNVPVVVDDIQADPLWAPFAELAKEAGVAACWSHPFTSNSGEVLGALALYAPEPQAPTAEQLSRLRAAARMTGLAVERGRAEEALREQRERERELENQLRQAAKMEALGVLAGGVAHDFNNVLNNILANAEFSLELNANDEVASMLGDIVTASRRAGEFCKQMLAYAGQSALKTATIELSGLLPQLSSLVQAALSKKATLRYALHAEPIFVEGDENQLLQVVLNLVTNAADALGDEAGEIVVSSELMRTEAPTASPLSAEGELPAGEYVKLSVRDTGCGMDAETIARVFDPFFTTKFTGRGLGLAAAKGIIRSHGGTIEIESVIGEGTTFTILLPTAESSGQRALVQAVTPPARKPRLLVADDEDGLRRIFAKRLRHQGYDVVEAADGQEAIDLFFDGPTDFDCVLLDLSMPRLSGDEVYRDLRAIREDIPIVVMSGYAEEEVLRKFEGATLAGVLQKPFPSVDMLEAIRSAVE